MKIDIQKVAKLSNLTLTPEELEEFDKQLNDVVGYIEKLNAVDTSSVEPTAQVTGLKNRTRDDGSIHTSLTQEEAILGSSKTHGGLFVVEKLVDTT